MKSLFFTCLAALAAGALFGADAEDWSRIYLAARPSVSADGQTFAFEWADRIWLAPTAGGEARPLAASDAALDGWPALTPDGSRVVFGSDRDGGTKLFEFTIKTGELRQVGFHSEGYRTYSYAPGCKEALCVVDRDHADAKHSDRIVLVPLDRRAPEEILFDAQAFEPALAPDGKRLLFVRRGDTLYRKRPHSHNASAGEIWLFDRTTRAFTLIVQKISDSRTPIWTPDGKGFYYISAETGTGNVVHHDLATHKERRVTNFVGDNALQPTLAANGHMLVVRQGFDFWRLDPTDPKAQPARIILHPSASWTRRPTTRRRMYTVIGNPDGDGGYSFNVGDDEGHEVAFTAGGGLYVMSTKNREPVRVHFESGALVRDCAFTKDGSALYFLLDHGDGTDLYRVTREDAKKCWHNNTSFRKTRLLADGVTRTALTISPDGTRLGWKANYHQLVFANTNGLDAVLGPQMPCRNKYVWSPDGKWVAAALSDDHANSDVWILSTTQARAPYNISRHFKWDGDPAWSPDGKILAWGAVRDEGRRLCYVYLDGQDGKGKPNEIDFTDLELRVKTVNTRAEDLFFNMDGHTLAFDNGSETQKISIPDDLSPKRLTPKRGYAQQWGTKKDKGRLLWMTSNLPAHFECTYKFETHPEVNVDDYFELLGRMAWGRIRDRFYDSKFHGADWPAVKTKFMPAFRHAPTVSVIQRLMGMLLGELDASHLGFIPTEVGRNEWVKWQQPSRPQNWCPLTGHLGLRFDPTFKGPGWRVKDVLRNGPVDKLCRGVRAGDIVTEVEGVKVCPHVDPTLVLNKPNGVKISFTFGHPGEPATNVVKVMPITFSAARNLVAQKTILDTRRRAHELSNGRVGYVYVDAMDFDSFRIFENEVFSEGYGRDALIVDVRDNHGGFTADRMLYMLCPPYHSYEIPRNGRAGYLLGYTMTPVWTKPIAVICNDQTGSNGEIFTHAVKTMKRGFVVGRETGGKVIATNNRSLLDFGDFCDAEYGWYRNDGTDMENNGAKPDYPIDITPIDETRGVDPQLELTVKKLLEQIGPQKKN